MQGRGPTSDISPRRTLISCGSSSRLVRRSQRPARVIASPRSSLYTPFPFAAASGAHRRSDVLAVRAVVDVASHRPELEERELLHHQPEPDLTEERRATRVEPDPQRDAEEEWPGDHEQEAGAHDVEQPLHEPGRTRQPNRWQPDERQRLDRMVGYARADDVEQTGNDVDLNVVVAQRADQGDRLGRRCPARTRPRPGLRPGVATISCSESVPPRRATCSSPGRRVAGWSSTKPTTLIPYSGCWITLRAMS